MTQIFVNGNVRKAFDGAVLITTDPVGTGTTFVLPAETFSLTITDNMSIFDLVDNAGFPVNDVLGVREGSFTADGLFKGDRGFTAILTTAFGPRTAGQLTSFYYTLIPYSGGTAIMGTGMFFSRGSLMGGFGQRGEDLAWRWHMEGVVTDPDNYFGATAQAIPAAAGTVGTGISTFGNSSFNNAAATPVVYQLIRMFRIDWDNQLDRIPTIAVPSARIGGGWVPGTIRGNVGITQLSGASPALPRTTGRYDLATLIPDGTGGVVTTLGVSMQWNQTAQSYAARNIGMAAIGYQLFATGLASPSFPWTIARA